VHAQAETPTRLRLRPRGGEFRVEIDVPVVPQGFRRMETEGVHADGCTRAGKRQSAVDEVVTVFWSTRAQETAGSFAVLAQW